MLHLEELDGRPELVRALVGAIRRDDDLAFEHVLRAARLLVDARDPELARLLVLPCCEGRRFRRVRRSREQDELARVLIDSGESAWALAVLRRTRSRGGRSWDDERDDGRLLCAAKALEALGRRRVARRLFDLQRNRR